MDTHLGVPSRLGRAIFRHLTQGPAVTAAKRVATLGKWVARARELGADAAGFSARPEGPAAVLKGKRIQLLREMLESIGYSDLAVCDMLRDGARLTGVAAPVGEFPEELKPPTVPKEDLRITAKWASKALMAKVGPSGDPELDEAVDQETKEEVRRGWLVGPLSASDLDGLHGEAEWIVSRRFGIRQGPDKIRVIDDYSESNVNSTFGSGNKVDVRGVDGMAAMVSLVITAARPGGVVEMPDGAGGFLRGRLGRGFVQGAGGGLGPLVGRTLDLKHAYRQVPIHPDDYKYSVLAVFATETGKD